MRLLYGNKQMWTRVWIFDRRLQLALCYDYLVAQSDKFEHEFYGFMSELCMVI